MTRRRRPVSAGDFYLVDFAVLLKTPLDLELTALRAWQYPCASGTRCRLKSGKSRPFLDVVLFFVWK
jgi:hypothetical protein